MARLGAVLVAIGSLLAAAGVLWQGWAMAFHPDANDPLGGFLSMAGVWGGAALLIVGIVLLAGHSNTRPSAPWHRPAGP
jgi:hypothetical protein